MSFLAGRLASSEGSYFLQESKQAVARIARNQKNNTNVVKTPQNNEISPSSSSSPPADVLPEILRHSLPSKLFTEDSVSSSSSSSSSFSKASKWVLERETVSRVSPHAINPLSAYVSMPQVTFGAKRWQLPNSENSVLASTANDLRQDKVAPINPEKLKAAAAGLTQIGSAFAVATAIVFGGSAFIFGIVASKLEVQNTDDIRTKGKGMVQPKIEVFKEQVAPLRTRAENMSKKWKMERGESIKEKPLVKELSKTLGARNST